MLASAGLTPSDVTLINLNFNLVSALRAGQVDAVVGGFRNFEPIELALGNQPARLFLPEDYGVPPYDELIYVTARAMKDDPRLPRFLAAVKEATKSRNKAREHFIWRTSAWPNAANSCRA